MARLVLRGRGEPMAAALATLRDASRSGRSGVLVVSGEAGIGKSAVLAELCDQARLLGFVVAAGRADQIWDFSGAALLSALRSGRAPLVDTKQAQALLALTDQPFALLDLVGDVLEERARTTPVLLAVDDAQWADPLSTLVLRNLPARLVGLPVVLVVCTRASAGRWETEVAVAAGTAVTVRDLPLAPLTRSDVAAIAADRLGRVPGPAARRMLDGIGGNPFLAVEILEALRRAEARGASVTDLPAEFIGTVRRRMTELDDCAISLVQLAAVVARPFGVDEAASLLHAAPVDVDAAADAAVDAGLLERIGHETTFRHDLVREAVYGALAPVVRRRLHAECAAHFLDVGAELLLAAQHARAAATPGDETSAAIMVRAAEATAPSLPDLAGELAAEAFALLRVNQATWTDIGERVARVLLQVQRPVESGKIADVLLARTDDADAVAELRILATQALWMAGRPGEVVSRVEQALLAPLTSAQRGRLLATRALARTRLEPAEVVARDAEELIARARLEQDDGTLRVALRAAAEAARNGGRHAEALRLFRALRTATGVTYLPEEITALQLVDRYADADVILAEARSDARANVGGLLPAMAFAELWQHFNLGRLDEAEASARTVISVSREVGSATFELEGRHILASVAMLRGELSRARALLGPVMPTAEGDPVKATAIALVQGWLVALEGDPVHAVRILSPDLFTARESRSYWPWWPGWMPVFVAIGQAAGDDAFVDEAAALAQVGAERNPGIASFEGIALVVRGKLAGDIDTVGEGRRIMARSPRLALQAMSAHEHGKLLLAAGRTAEGVAALDQAWDGYRAMGNTAATGRVQQTLRELGVRRVKWSVGEERPTAGWNSLTEAEKRVATVIAGGETNKAAARQLGVSVNTVGTHLRSVFTKLALHSRAQLANAVRDHTDNTDTTHPNT